MPARQIHDVFYSLSYQFCTYKISGMEEKKYCIFCGDGNTVLTGCEPIVEAGPVDLQALIEYFKNHDTLSDSYREAEGRITVK